VGSRVGHACNLSIPVRVGLDRLQDWTNLFHEEEEDDESASIPYS
jgi:hypothetical protein